LVFNSFRYDLRESVEPFGMTQAAHTVAAVNPFSRFANHAPVTFKRNGELFLFRYPLQALQFIRNLAAAKEWLEHEGVTVGHDLGDFLLYDPLKLGLINASALTNECCRRRN